MASVFTCDLDFLSKFLGHQGASSKWLCIFCLAITEKLADIFHTGGVVPRYERRTLESFKQNYQVYVENFLNLPKNEQTNDARAAVT